MSKEELWIPRFIRAVNSLGTRKRRGRNEHPAKALTPIPLKKVALVNTAPTIVKDDVDDVKTNRDIAWIHQPRVQGLFSQELFKEFGNDDDTSKVYIMFFGVVCLTLL